MEEIFYGSWSVFGENPQAQDVPYRLRIEESDNSDGIYYFENDVLWEDKRILVSP